MIIECDDKVYNPLGGGSYVFEKDVAKIIDTIGVWDIELAKTASRIIKIRKSFIKKLLPFAQVYLKELSENKEDLNITYIGQPGEETEEIYIVVDCYTNCWQCGVDADM